ncbi:MAG: hypothetical protein IJ762_03130 [Bacteroidaceae bacterium]|nr:hypothetical protein [Bacteroidaceae bacterium]
MTKETIFIILLAILLAPACIEAKKKVKKVEVPQLLEPNNIKGEHIHITRSEWGYLQEKFQFTAIPFVVLLDKKGKLRENVTVEQLLEEK